MYVFFAQILTILLSYGEGDLLYPIECELRSLETTLDTNVHVEASVSYPHVVETSHFARFVNEAVQNEALELHDTFLQEMSSSKEELGEERVGYELRYDLSLVDSTPGLMSFFGTEYHYYGGVHGVVRYITKTFCQHGDTIRELSLDDLFLPGSRAWLFEYCEDYFNSNESINDNCTWVGLNPEHLDAFLLTEKGLLLIFQNYIVSGCGDDPTTLLIPYDKLASIANPDFAIKIASSTPALEGRLPYFLGSKK